MIHSPLHTTLLAAPVLAQPHSVNPDSLGGAPFGHFVVGGEGVTTPFREVTPDQLFGVHSEQAAIPLGEGAAFDPIATSGYSLLVLVLLLAYAVLLYRHAGDIRQLLGRMLQDRSSDDRLYEDSGSSFSRFLTLCNLFGLFLAGAVVMRLASAWIPVAYQQQYPQMAALLGSLAVVGALIVAALYRWGATALIRVITFTAPLFEQLQLIKRTFVALVTILTLPLFSLWLLTPEGDGGFWLKVIIIELAVTSILYLHETHQLFISKKISILHWILYLCAVEIFPLSLLWLLAVRYI